MHLDCHCDSCRTPASFLSSSQSSFSSRWIGPLRAVLARWYRRDRDDHSAAPRHAPLPERHPEKHPPVALRNIRGLSVRVRSSARPRRHRPSATTLSSPQASGEQQLDDANCKDGCNECVCSARGGTVVSTCRAASSMAALPADDPRRGICGNTVCGKASLCCNASCAMRADGRVLCAASL